MRGVPGLPGLLDAQPGGLRLAGGAADRRKGDRRRAEPIDERCVHSGEEQAGGDGENQRFQGLDEKENEGEGREVWKRRSAEEHGSSSGGGKRGGGFFINRVFR